MMTFLQSEWLIDKANRANAYFSYQFGWRQRDCTACNGSGIYDNDGSPPCGGCDGTGKERFKGPKYSATAFEIHNPKLFEIWRMSR